MSKKIYTQSLLIFILFFISFFLYFKYFKQSNFKKDLKTDMEKNLSSSESMIEDLKYLSTDKEGNEYEILAKRGNIDKDNPDIIYLENVVAVISMKNSEFISIKSNFAKYNSKTYDTLFNKEVSVDYGEHIIKSEFLDLSFENSLVSIYDNVRYLGGISSLKADKAEIDILNKRTKIFMEDADKKVQINSISTNGNN